MIMNRKAREAACRVVVVMQVPRWQMADGHEQESDGCGEKLGDVVEGEGEKRHERDGDGEGGRDLMLGRGEDEKRLRWVSLSLDLT